MEHWSRTSSVEPFPLGRREKNQKLEFPKVQVESPANALPIVTTPQGVFRRPIDAAKGKHFEVPRMLQVDDKVLPRSVTKKVLNLQNGVETEEKGSCFHATPCHEAERITSFWNVERKMHSGYHQKKNLRQIGNAEDHPKPPSSDSSKNASTSSISGQQRSDLKGKEKGNTTMARDKVMEILHDFRTYCKDLSKEHGNNIRRVDFMAAKLVKKKFRYMDRQILGSVPGVEIGDGFLYRMELNVVGLHRPPQGGIDYTYDKGRKIATSIVASGVYENYVSDPDTLVYCGQGGNLTGGEGQAEDQKLTDGNLALKNSIAAKNHVRVIKGFKSLKASIIYTYDGLYTVEKMWRDRGSNGKLIFKFKLVKVPGQLNHLQKNTKVRSDID